MITIEVAVGRIAGVKREELEGWVEKAWVRPERQDGRLLFREIDVARARLIKQLRDEMEVNEAALPVVLSLLDQLYDTRWRLRALAAVLGRTAPDAVRALVAGVVERPTD